jgi:hypothetical protein
MLVVDGIVTQSSATPFLGSVVASSSQYHVAPMVMAEIMKKCPGVITVTTSTDNVDYILSPQARGSTLTNPKGDVLYISPAFKAKNLAKDVCLYVATHSN